MTVGVVVPAAGAGIRLGPGSPKALRVLAGEPLLVHAVRRLRACPSIGPVVVAAPPAAVAEVVALLAAYAVTVVPGGAERQDSVAAALAALPAEVELVLVHDAARALVPVEVVEAVVSALRDGADAVVPVLPVADTVKQVGVGGEVLGTVPREDLRLVQTPQGFRREVLEAAHRAAPGSLTDDAGLVEAAGVTVHTVLGSAEAFKVTTPFDLLVAEAVLARG
ncbi:MAG: 2-C-methyl-D-erythritol 4-phosphate cytidylyltransferase [Frankiales bacterium]|nr:2-C-methyl-D-erythritol 4-phosphate cytidylyltransferase [Frankiales bacterium]